MRRRFLTLLTLVLSGSAAAADFLQASAIQQGALQLRTEVAALRSTLVRPDINPQATLAIYAPALLERARAVRSQAAAYRQQIEASMDSAEYKRQAAEAEYHINNLEAAIRELGAMINQLSASVKKLDEIAQKMEELLPRIQAMVGAACTLPHASTAIVKGACAIAACERGYLDADGNAANGCEVPAR